MRLEILDTPGFLLDSDISEPKTRREFAKFIGVSSPGPHVFAFVFPAAHIHKCDLEIFQRFVSVFGEDVLNYTILLFTKTDDLNHFSLTKQSFFLSAPAEWKAIMKSCHYRCTWFQNRANPLEKELMVRSFIDMMEITINKNMGRHFTNDLYWEAEKALVMRNLANVDHDKLVEKLTRRLRINLDAGPLTRFGEPRKSTATRRERMRREIETDNFQVIDRIWNAIKTFHCLKILKRPKLPYIPKQTLPKIYRRTLKPSKVYKL
ncbi:hypothetical protein ACJMK2_026771 [Sinanodonta woodiana]|uniref:AIG1-type G domain-containing protein n=1 Tax=Sinanodonta woodiana TaxID=1069815 RepID=A0ABD3XM82_SINWO